MRSTAFLAALVSLAVTAVDARTCTVETLSPSGPGSITDCLEFAHASTARRILIEFSDSLAGGEIDLHDGEGNCVSTPTIRNPNLGERVKKVFIRGPRVGEGVPHIKIVAPLPACENEIIFNFGEDVSVDIQRLELLGGGIGIFVAGTSTPPGGENGLDETVDLESVTVKGAAIYGVELLDIADVHISDCKVDDCGNDGLRYEQIFGIPGGACSISITGSEFDRNGIVNTASGDGADIKVNVVPCTISVKTSEFDENSDDGLDIDNDGSNGNGAITVFKTEFDDNGFGEGADGDGLKLTHIDAVVKFSEFDNNYNDGMAVEFGEFECLKSEFDGNGDDGLDLDESLATSISRCDFSLNAEYGIELEIAAGGSASIIENIHKSTLKDNGLGAFICNEQRQAEGRSGNASDDDEEISAGAAEKASRLDGGRGKK